MFIKPSTLSLLIFLLLFAFKASAQSIKLTTLNTGGGSHTSQDYHVDWSIGEAASIETF